MDFLGLYSTLSWSVLEIFLPREFNPPDIAFIVKKISGLFQNVCKCKNAV